MHVLDTKVAPGRDPWLNPLALAAKVSEMMPADPVNELGWVLGEC